MAGYTRVKICGNTCVADVDMAVRYGADAVGFIVDVPVDTHRKISATMAQELVASVPVFVDTVLVTMPESAESALSLIGTVEPDIVQIHNDLDIASLLRIREESGIRLIKSISIPVDAVAACIVEDTLDYIGSISHIVDAVLLDTKAASNDGGGTGRVHDWGISSMIVAGSPLPVILAGGLNPDNVAAAVSEVAPYGVDTASGVETGRKKDEEKVRRFIAYSRGYV